MRVRRVMVGAVVVVVGAVVVACSGGSMALKDWMQGSWSCTATNTDNEGYAESEDLVVEVEDGTWAITSVTNPDGWGVMEPTNGTWSLSPAGLQVDVDYNGVSGV